MVLRPYFDTNFDTTPPLRLLKPGRLDEFTFAAERREHYAGSLDTEPP